MTIKELKRIIKAENIPDNAEIIIFADHGQNYEKSSSYAITRSKIDNKKMI